ncbi:MAG: phosphoribosylformylglycinamidine synthase I [Planctomycetes bacterium GWF2_50_10]|nr:MAG: phosphoribosylformylglycinamidine synthase I [Planctomycetes bacterium GWF2_50_10]
MAEVKAIVLRAAGINCDLETEHALELAGASAERIHINRVIESPGVLDGFQIMVVPGGFSYGDDVAAGKILANQIKHHLYDAARKFIDSGKLVLGICNGFQVLVKAGLLPGRIDGEAMTEQSVTITYNDSGKFEDRWVYLEAVSSRCIFLEQGRRICLPIAHGEGKVVFKDEATRAKINSEGFAALRYVDKDGNAGTFPVNPNGSTDAIAGLTDATGRVLGLMPHPERFVRVTQHPHWTRIKDTCTADGIGIFENAVKYVRGNL